MGKKTAAQLEREIRQAEPDRASWALGELERAQLERTSGRMIERVVPGIASWNMYAGGTASPGKASYSINLPEGEYHVDPSADARGRHLGYRLRLAARERPRDGHGGLWHDLGTYRSPAKAASAARAHYAKSYGDQSQLKLKDRYSGGHVWLSLRDGVVVGAMGADPKRYIGLTVDEARRRARYGGGGK